MPRGIRARLLIACVILCGCSERDSAKVPRAETTGTLVIADPAPPPAAAPVPPTSDSAAVADVRLDTAGITERFVTPEVVFRYERGGRAEDVALYDGAARIVRIEGPQHAGSGGPSYALHVSWYPLAPATSLEAWARVHADPDPDDEAEEKAAAGGPPVPAGGTWPDTVSGRPALAQSLAGPDATLERRYVMAGPWVLVFRYERYPTDPPTSASVTGPPALLDRLEWARK